MSFLRCMIESDLKNDPNGIHLDELTIPYAFKHLNVISLFQLTLK